MKFKLDENISPSLATLFVTAGHDMHSVAQEALGGASDLRVIDVCRQEQRALITLDLDFSNIVAYPRGQYPGIVVLRLGGQANSIVESALHRVLGLLARETLSGMLWIVEDHRVRIHG